ncbi:coronatine-insensitive protein 1-like protein [Tanacetum coccineum]|uniref:Coronatine-insensitive protein 1-like protein n=1 Tax=Tanacetum coccineum TaxID=301880 RepID=A0ABQ4YUZ2_9ASTR
MTRLDTYDCEDLVLLAKNCSESLVALKVGDCPFKYLVEILRYADRLEDFGGSVHIDESDGNVVVANFPSKMIRSIALSHGSARHILGIRVCPNLEELYTSYAIGDLGLKHVGQICKKLRTVKIEKVHVNGDMLVSHTGLIDLAEGCPELEYLRVNVKDITNDALECIGTHLKKLFDFCLILDHKVEPVSDLPLDNGIRALLGCTKLEKLGIHLRAGGLTDVGLGHVGKYGQNIKYLFLGLCGKCDIGRESDAGLIELLKWCPKLQKLDMKGCVFIQKALATFVLNVTSLRYLWVQAYPISESSDTDYILAMARPFWNMELIRYESDNADAPEGPIQQQPSSLLAYYSLAGQRKDFPDSVIPIYPPVDSE